MLEAYLRVSARERERLEEGKKTKRKLETKRISSFPFSSFLFRILILLLLGMWWGGSERAEHTTDGSYRVGFRRVRMRRLQTQAGKQMTSSWRMMTWSPKCSLFLFPFLLSSRFPHPPPPPLRMLEISSVASCSRSESHRCWLRLQRVADSLCRSICPSRVCEWRPRSARWWDRRRRLCGSSSRQEHKEKIRRIETEGKAKEIRRRVSASPSTYLLFSSLLLFFLLLLLLLSFDWWRHDDSLLRIQSADPGAPSKSLIFKTGDDLRQDMLTLQVEQATPYDWLLMTSSSSPRKRFYDWFFFLSHSPSWWRHQRLDLSLLTLSLSLSLLSRYYWILFPSSPFLSFRKMFRVMDKLWKKDKLDLNLSIYGCVSTNFEEGMIEVVPAARTLSDLELKFKVRERWRVMTSSSGFSEEKQK